MRRRALFDLYLGGMLGAWGVVFAWSAAAQDVLWGATAGAMLAVWATVAVLRLRGWL